MNMLLFWLAALLLTTVTTVAVLAPLLRRNSPAASSRAAHDLEVYGAQIAEIDGDIERGTLSPAEAAGARAEIGRRVLKAAAGAREDGKAAGASGRIARTAAIFAVGLGIPMGALGLYAHYGSPRMPDLPLEARLAVDPARADLPTLVAQVEARLRQRPDDGGGWEMLAPIYLRAGRADDASTAFANAIRILGSTPEREGGLGEALTQMASGEVTSEAKAAFDRALALQPDYLPAQFFLALGLTQDGRFAEAKGAWSALIEKSPPNAPWLQIAEAARADAQNHLGEGETPVAAPGPKPEDIAAASQMSGAERSDMIGGMVAQLAARLKTAPNDVDGWKRLIRSYKVLGDDERARGALAEASAVFAEGSAERGEIASFGQELGMAPAGATPATETKTQ